MLDDGREKMVQGVRELFEIFDNPIQEVTDSHAQGKMVLIGRHLGEHDFAANLRQALSFAG